MVYFSFSSNLYIFFNLLPQIGPQILDINVYERFLQNLQIQMRRASGVMIFYYEFIIPVSKLIQFLKNFFFLGGDMDMLIFTLYCLFIGVKLPDYPTAPKKLQPIQDTNMLHNACEYRWQLIKHVNMCCGTTT